MIADVVTSRKRMWLVVKRGSIISLQLIKGMFSSSLKTMRNFNAYSAVLRMLSLSTSYRRSTLARVSIVLSKVDSVHPSNLSATSDRILTSSSNCKIPMFARLTSVSNLEISLSPNVSRSYLI